MNIGQVTGMDIFDLQLRNVHEVPVGVASTLGGSIVLTTLRGAAEFSFSVAGRATKYTAFEQATTTFVKNRRVSQDSVPLSGYVVTWAGRAASAMGTQAATPGLPTSVHARS